MDPSTLEAVYLVAEDTYAKAVATFAEALRRADGKVEATEAFFRAEATYRTALEARFAYLLNDGTKR